MDRINNSTSKCGVQNAGQLGIAWVGHPVIRTHKWDERNLNWNGSYTSESLGPAVSLYKKGNRDEVLNMYLLVINVVLDCPALNLAIFPLHCA
jgi:hypothetical protein